MRKIIFGGAFDPIHMGHVLMAKQASKQFDADVIFVPAVISVWKETTTDFEHKVNMIKLLIKDEKRFSISRYERDTKRDVNYSINTVKHFKEKFPNDELFFLIGGDQVNKFHLWKDAEELASLARIIYYSRNDLDINTPNIEKYHMTKVEGENIDISSTELRDMTFFDYLPFELAKYMVDNDLYSFSRLKDKLSLKRYSHSKEVAMLSYKIALSNNLKTPLKAFYAGMLHDVGKEVDKGLAEKIMKEEFSEFSDLPRFSYHQFIGAYIAKNEYCMPEDIVDAIKYHATGTYPMSDLAKIVYSADKIEPTRGFDSSDLINSCLQNYEKGFLDVLKANKEFLESNRKDINNRLTVKCFDNYLTH